LPSAATINSKIYITKQKSTAINPREKNFAEKKSSEQFVILSLISRVKVVFTEKRLHIKDSVLRRDFTHGTENLTY
jgi:hypothetical protein